MIQMSDEVDFLRTYALREKFPEIRGVRGAKHPYFRALLSPEKSKKIPPAKSGGKVTMACSRIAKARAFSSEMMNDLTANWAKK